jgi:hypothetical protein
LSLSDKGRDRVTTILAVLATPNAAAPNLTGPDVRPKTRPLATLVCRGASVGGILGVNSAEEAVRSVPIFRSRITNPDGSAGVVEWHPHERLPTTRSKKANDTGQVYIDATHDSINSFYSESLNPYLNYHRPCVQAETSQAIQTSSSVYPKLGRHLMSRSINCNEANS